MRVWLRPVSKDDAKYIVQWRSSDKIRKHCLSNNIVTKKTNEQFFANNIINGKYIQFIVERIDKDFEQFSYPIGTIYIKNIDEQYNCCEIGFFPSEDEEWNDISKIMALEQLINIVSKKRKFIKIYSNVFEDCSDELELYKKAGFKETGELTIETSITDTSRRLLQLVYCYTDKCIV